MVEGSASELPFHISEVRIQGLDLLIHLIN